MHCELPRILRCCFCVPLRYGILIFGYFNLLISILLISYLSCMYNPNRFYRDTPVVPMHGVMLFEVHLAVPLTLYCAEFIFNMVLIIGSHKKNTTLLKVFYYYGLNSAVATFLMFCIQASKITEYDYLFLSTILIFTSLAFIGFVLHIYLIILVKNEITKLDNNQQFYFINHAAEAIGETETMDAIYRNTTTEMI